MKSISALSNSGAMCLLLIDAGLLSTTTDAIASTASEQNCSFFFLPDALRPSSVSD
jgi:hypothetical protein